MGSTVVLPIFYNFLHDMPNNKTKSNYYLNGL